jgi:hypothetical protein
LAKEWCGGNYEKTKGSKRRNEIAIIGGYIKSFQYPAKRISCVQVWKNAIVKKKKCRSIRTASNTKLGNTQIKQVL